MAKHDIVLLNTTSSGFETDLGSNVARIKGDADNLFSVSDGSNVDKFVVNSVGDSITISGDLTLTGNLSSSLASTASFGRIDVTNLTGDASQMTNTNQIGHVSSSKQLAARISGAFQAGFVLEGENRVISGSATSTGSFSKVFANVYSGDASDMFNVPTDAGTVSGSAQLASDISGSFNKGFELSSNSLLGTATPTPYNTTSIKLDESDDYMKIIPMFTSGSDGDDKLYGERRFTFSTWIKFHADNGSRNTFIMAGAAAGSQNGVYVYMQNNQLRGEFKVKHGSTMSGTGDSLFGTIELNRWHHLLLSYESNRPNPTASGSFITALDGKQILAKVMQSGSYIDNPAPAGDSVIGTYAGSGENPDMSFADVTMWKHSIQSASTDAGIDSGSLITTLFNHGIVPDYTASFSTGYPDAYREKLKFAFNFNSASYAGGSYSMYDRTGNTDFTLTSVDVDEGKIVSGSGDSPSEGVFYTTGSFGRLDVSGILNASDASQTTGVTEALPSGVFSSSAQLASDISGSFIGGFEITQDSVYGTGNIISHSAAQTGSVTASLSSKGFIISGSATSTGSFGHFNMGDYGGFGTTSQLSSSIARVAGATHGGKIEITDTSELTGWSSAGFISSSAQIAADISGSFNKGFGFGDSIGITTHHLNSGNYYNETKPTGSRNIISGSSTSTGSFGRIDNITSILADASDTTGLSIPSGTVSASAQLAADISGSFNKGFAVDGDISGSATSTGSFSRLDFIDPISATDVSGITGHETGHLTGASGIAADISGSFTSGFNFSGTISASTDSTLKVQSLELAGTNNFVESNLVKNWDSALIRSATYGTNLASDISGAFDHGFGFQGTISGSSTSTGSFSQIKSKELFVNQMVGVRKPISGSMDHDNYISASFKTNSHGRVTIPVRGKIFSSVNTKQFTATGSMQDQKYRARAGQLFVDNWGRLNMTVQTGSMVAQTAAWSTPYPSGLSGRFGGVASKSTTAGAGGQQNTWKQYDGLSVKDIPGAGGNNYGWTTGIQIAGDGIDDMITFSNGFPADNDTMVWNGSVWYKVQNTPINVYSSVVLTQGTQNDSGFIGGQYGGPHGCTLMNWNGVSWHDTGQALITGRFYANGSGTTNAGLVTGGWEASPTATTCTEEWNGTTWATAGALGRAQQGGVAGGTQNATTYYGGYPNAYTEEYNGNTWSTGPDGPNATTQAGGSGGAGNMMQNSGLYGAAGIHIFETSYVTGSSATHNNFQPAANGDGRYLLTKRLQANYSPGTSGGITSGSSDGYGGGY